jgi:hypothetical protein
VIELGILLGVVNAVGEILAIWLVLAALVVVLRWMQK